MSNHFPSEFITLRKRAEEIVIKKTDNVVSQLSETDVLKLIHELEVHQIELELQNEELQLAKEQAAEAATKKYEELYNFAPTGYFTLSKEGVIVELNLYASLLLGKEHQNLISSSFGFFVTDDTKAIFNHFLENAFTSKTKETCELTLLTSSNTPIDVYLTGSAANNNEQCLITVMDISEQKETKKQLQLLSKAIEQSPVSVIITDKKGHIEYVNLKFTKLTGYTLEEVKGKNPRFLRYSDKAEEFYKDLWSTILSGNDWHGELHNKKKNGDPYWESAVISPIVNNQGDISYFIAVKEDISEKKKMLEDLIIAKEQAEESNRLKTAFLQNMSHEIRTPMNAIMGFSTLLVRNYDNRPKLEKFANIITRRCSDLLEIINDILNISKIESGQLSVNLESFNIKDLFAELTLFFEEYKKRIGKEHIKFNLVALCSQSELAIETDKVKLKQIFINLIGNAFKFTESGRIEGGCKLDANHNLVFYVSDTGIGIPSDKHELVFERFTQLKNRLSNASGGTGLGLPIVKGLVKLLGGEIWLKSEQGRGSTFSFSFPHKTIRPLRFDPLEVNEHIIYNFYGKTILLVEDDLYNTEYIKEVFADTGAILQHAILGKDAIQLALTQPVNLILMDIRLPDIDGYEVTRLIKQCKPDLQIIALTAYASVDEKQYALSVGCDEYVSKPTEVESLLKLIDKHLSLNK